MHDRSSRTSPEVPSPRLVAAWLSLGTLPIERVPLWAAHWIAHGRDGESLRVLSGLSGNNPHDVRDLIGEALRECAVDDDELPPAASVTKAAAMAAFTAAAELQAGGRASERWVVSKVYELIGPDFEPELTGIPLARLFSLEDEWSAPWARAGDKLRVEVQAACRDQLVAAYDVLPPSTSDPTIDAVRGGASTFVKDEDDAKITG